MAALGLRYCRLSLIVASRGYSPAAVCRILLAGASLVAEHGLYAHGSVAAAHGL